MHHSRTGIASAASLIAALILRTPFAVAEEAGPEVAVVEKGSGYIDVVDGRVHADLPFTPLAELLRQLADAAGIGLTLVGNIEGAAKLDAKGARLYRVVDHLLSEGHGYAFELGPDRSIRQLIVFTGGGNSSSLQAVNERQRYLARQTGRRDDTTAAVMHETLSNRGLDDSQAKLIAIEQLADMGSENARDSLQAGIGDPDPQVRLATARALYRLRGDDALTLIGQIYYAGDSASIRKDLAALVAGSSHPLARGIVQDGSLKK